MIKIFSLSTKQKHAFKKFVWDVHTGKLLRIFSENLTKEPSISLSTDGYTVAVATDEKRLAGLIGEIRRNTQAKHRNTQKHPSNTQKYPSKNTPSKTPRQRRLVLGAMDITKTVFRALLGHTNVK